MADAVGSSCVVADAVGPHARSGAVGPSCVVADAVGPHARSGTKPRAHGGAGTIAIAMYVKKENLPTVDVAHAAMRRAVERFLEPAARRPGFLRKRRGARPASGGTAAARGTALE